VGGEEIDAVAPLVRRGSHRLSAKFGDPSNEIERLGQQFDCRKTEIRLGSSYEQSCASRMVSTAGSRRGASQQQGKRGRKISPQKIRVTH
jgi:hypothetical protein